MVWPTTPGSGPLTIDGNMTVASLHNYNLGSLADASSGQIVFAMANVVSAPSSLAGLVGGVLYVQSGTLMYMGALGTVTSIAVK